MSMSGKEKVQIVEAIGFFALLIAITFMIGYDSTVDDCVSACGDNGVARATAEECVCR